MRYLEYESWLQVEHSKIVLEPHCSEVGPLVAPTTKPDCPPWNMDWCVMFPDGKYCVVRERWFGRRGTPFGAGGHRKMFAFHYGVAPSGRDQDGIPVKDSAYETIIRVDMDWRGPHMHFGGADHILQHRVSGFLISDADAFLFVKAVLQHRSVGTDFPTLLGFTVTS